MPAPVLQWKTVRVPVPDTSPLRQLFNAVPTANTLLTSANVVPSAVDAELPDLSAFPTPLDKAQALLLNAAEVEHELLVQYLYAAYSLKTEASQLPDPTSLALTTKWRRLLVGIATEEMGHLMTVQNLLLLLNLPLHFERGDKNVSQLHPFVLNLEPVSKESLAKYVAAEMPAPTDPIDPEIEEILKRATGGAGMAVNRVGVVYGLLGLVFARHEDLPVFAASADPWQRSVAHFGDILFAQLQEDPDAWHLPDEVLHPESLSHQATGSDWGQGNIFVDTATTREEALKAFQEIGEQGEGPVTGSDGSHFERFLGIYKEFPEAGVWQPAKAVPVNPRLANGQPPGPSDITNPRSQQWAALCDGQYHQLLDTLEHFLSLDSANAVDAEKRGTLLGWAFDIMTGSLRGVAPRITDLPLGDSGNPTRAGAPFTIVAPEMFADDAARWVHQQNGIEATLALVVVMQQDPENQASPLLMNLLTSIQTTETQHLDDAKRGGVAAPHPPDPTPPTHQTIQYPRVQEILQTAVNNADIGAHGNFWQDLTRDEFIAKKVFGLALIVRKVDGSFDPDESNLIKALEGRAPFGSDIGTVGATRRRMPADLPPVGPELIAQLRQWIVGGCPA